MNETIRNDSSSPNDSTIASEAEKNAGSISDALRQEHIESDSRYIAERVIEANPGVKIIYGPVGQCIYTDVAGEDLVVPEPYYYNRKNGFTNKHRTKSGIYGTLDVRSLKDFYPEFEELEDEYNN